MKTPPKPNALYVHIPFCKSICPYCDFPKVYFRQDWAEKYLEELFREAGQRAHNDYTSIYIGGGTPSCLSIEQLDRLLSFFQNMLVDQGEFTIECNPDSLTIEKIAILKRHGINRVSVGAQSSVRKSLKTLGRNHDWNAVKEAVRNLREGGITNINLDWMYGFPDQTEEELREDIKNFTALNVEHLSAYSLILEEGTTYHAKGVKPLHDDVQQDYFDLIEQALIEQRYMRYEISNFCRDGYRCQHNLVYWKNLNYVGIGLGAAGFIGNVRYRNTKSLKRYLAGEWEDEHDELTEASAIEDYFLTNLRLTEGFLIEDFNDRFEIDFLKEYAEEIEQLRARGLLYADGVQVHCTHDGLRLLDQVLLTLFR